MELQNPATRIIGKERMVCSALDCQGEDLIWLGMMLRV